MRHPVQHDHQTEECAGCGGEFLYEDLREIEGDRVGKDAVELLEVCQECREAFSGIENKVAEGELVTLAEVEKLATELIILPLRQWLLSLPTTLDVRCNPGEPPVARLALQQARDEALRLLREKLK